VGSDAGTALTEYVDEIASNGGRPNGDGQFFLGRAVGDPGALFYIVSDLFRMTPVMLIGLLPVPLALLSKEPRTGTRRANQEPGATTDDRRPTTAGQWTI